MEEVNKNTKVINNRNLGDTISKITGHYNMTSEAEGMAVVSICIRGKGFL